MAECIATEGDLRRQRGAREDCHLPSPLGKKRGPTIPEGTCTRHAARPSAPGSDEGRTRTPSDVPLTKMLRVTSNLVFHIESPHHGQGGGGIRSSGNEEVSPLVS